MSLWETARVGSPIFEGFRPRSIVHARSETLIRTSAFGWDAVNGPDDNKWPFIESLKTVGGTTVDVYDKGGGPVEIGGEKGMDIFARISAGGLNGPWILQRVTVTQLGSKECDGTFEHECEYYTLEAWRLAVGKKGEEKLMKYEDTGEGHIPYDPLGQITKQKIGGGQGGDLQRNPTRTHKADCGICEGKLKVKVEIWDGQKPSSNTDRLGAKFGYIFIERKVTKQACNCPEKLDKSDEMGPYLWGDTEVSSTPAPKGYSYEIGWNRCSDPDCGPLIGGPPPSSPPPGGPPPGGPPPTTPGERGSTPGYVPGSGPWHGPRPSPQVDPFL